MWRYSGSGVCGPLWSIGCLEILNTGGRAVLELIITICSIVSGASCRDIHMIYSMEDVSLMQCMMGAQPEIAKWAERNPNWSIMRWRCAPAGVFANI